MLSGLFFSFFILLLEIYMMSSSWLELVFVFLSLPTSFQWENDQLLEQVAVLREEQAAISEKLSSDSFIADACEVAGSKSEVDHNRLRASVSAAMQQAVSDVRRRRENAVAAGGVSSTAMSAVGSVVRFRNNVNTAVRGPIGHVEGASQASVQTSDVPSLSGIGATSSLGQAKPQETIV